MHVNCGSHEARCASPSHLNPIHRITPGIRSEKDGEIGVLCIPGQTLPNRDASRSKSQTGCTARNVRENAFETTVLQNLELFRHSIPFRSLRSARENKYFMPSFWGRGWGSEGKGSLQIEIKQQQWHPLAKERHTALSKCTKSTQMCLWVLLV